MTSALAPGATIGILGGGQLGRMMALEARRMGYRVAVLDPDPHCPTAQFADACVAAPLDDVEAARALAKQSDVVTLDTEHVSLRALEAVESIRPVRPGRHVLEIIQDRLAQRRFLERIGIAQPEFFPISEEASLAGVDGGALLPGVIKTCHAGYDGKGQARVSGAAELETAWRDMGKPKAVLEAWVDIELEISVLLARDVEGRMAFYPIAENEHRGHVLRTTHVPARIPTPVATQARAMAARVAEALDIIGMMALEMYVTRSGALLVNEIAPRPHNSGHFSLGASATSQFEQHVRAVLGLPLGDASLLRSAAMVNLFGDLWMNGAPDFGVVYAHPTARLHLYGKSDAKPGRKMGHVLILETEGARAADIAEAIERALGIGALESSSTRSG